MKIEERVCNYLTLSENQPAKPGAKPPAGAERAPVEVDLSPDSTRMAEDEARRLRLDIIRQQLAEGSYNISGKDVAEKILNVLKG
ncbi:MAG: flagellar biosynthesis anti-sigma factor FlgM [Desulfuromonadaceae bacterium]|nr:flagellar biosynthesis anti-sigma factor FlgM [Desulfuromonadaceae bacterium]